MDSRARRFPSLKTGAATPLTNLCSDAGVGRRLGCLDISYLGGFHGFQGQKVCQPVAACGGLKGRAVAPLTNLCSDAGVGRLVDWKSGCPYWKIGILQSCRFGGLDAWMPGCWQDWIGSGWLLDRRKWWDGVDGKTSHTLELRGARGMIKI